MNVLAIETSTEIASLALKVNNEIVSIEQPNQKTHAKVLLVLIEQLLSEAGLTVKQLDAIAFGQGPGSFTGLRVACSIAKGLAYPHDMGLIPVSTLSAIAWEARALKNNADTSVLALIDARMHELYWALFAPQSFETCEQVSPVSEIALDGFSSILLAGTGFEAYDADLPLSVKKQIIERMQIYPKASALIGLSQRGQIKMISAGEAQPVYIRNKVTQGESRG